MGYEEWVMGMSNVKAIGHFLPVNLFSFWHFPQQLEKMFQLQIDDSDKEAKILLIVLNQVPETLGSGHYLWVGGGRCK